MTDKIPTMLPLSLLGLFVAMCVTFCAGQSRTVEFYEFGETVVMNCTSKNLQKHNDTFVHYWLVPDYKVGENTPMYVNETYNMSATWIEGDGWQLHVGAIRHTESGKYSCIWQEMGEEQSEDIELKFIPPGHWEVYKDNVTVGLIATAAFVGIIIVIFLVYYFRWKDPPKESDGILFTVNGKEQRSDVVHENLAFNPAGDPVIQVVQRNSAAMSESKM